MLFYRKRRIGLDRRSVENRNVVLCSTTNFRAGRYAAKALMSSDIPYSRHWENIPFFERSKFKGAEELCVIQVNRNEYQRARRAIGKIEPCFFKRLEINVI